MITSRVRYCRINIFKTVFNYSFLISFLKISFDITVCRRNSLHICSHLSAPFNLFSATTLLTSSLTCVKGKVKVTSVFDNAFDKG